jgi:hypothetical protein
MQCNNIEARQTADIVYVLLVAALASSSTIGDIYVPTVRTSFAQRKPANRIHTASEKGAAW